MGVYEHTEPDDLDLLGRIALRDAEALARLYDRFAPRVLGLLVRLLGRRPDAEDVLQETFLQVWKNASRYDATRSTPLTWLLLIARSRALDHLRRHRLYPVDLGTETPIDHDSFGDIERDESAGRLRDLLGQLPEPQRAALAHAYFGGLSHVQVAALQGVPVGTAKTRIRMGLQRLRDLLDGSQKGAHA